MQPIQKKTHGKRFICIAGSAWVAGLLIAGSDSPYMPWVNGMGLIIFFLASLLIGKHFRLSQPSTKPVTSSRCSQQDAVQYPISKKRLKNIHMPLVSISKNRNLLWS